MAAEQFNKDFWVAVAAAAPVIGLAAVVSADHSARRLERALARELKGGSHLRPWVQMLVYTINFLVMFAEGLALLGALFSLIGRVDEEPAITVAWVVAGGMLLIAMPSLVSVFALQPKRDDRASQPRAGN